MSLDVNFNELKAYSNRIKAKNFVDDLIIYIAKELATQLLYNLGKNTPVDTGRLLSGWTGNAKTSVEQFAHSLDVRKVSNKYVITIVNDVEYASFVELGHKTANDGFVPGQYFMKISEDELKSNIQFVQDDIEKELRRWLA